MISSKLLILFVSAVDMDNLQTSVTAAGCYLCPAPGSKGTKMLVCCSVNHPSPAKLELIRVPSDEKNKHEANELEKILADGKLSSDHLVPDPEEVQFLNVRSDHILLEAKRLKILSEATYNTILQLQMEETQNFQRKASNSSEFEQKTEGELKPSCDAEQVYHGNVYCFMKRFFLKFEWLSKITVKSSECRLETDERNLEHTTCARGHGMAVYARPMIDTDWLYLAKLSDSKVDEFQSRVSSTSSHDATGSTEIMISGLDYTTLSAQKSLLKLKKIPAAARRALPVLIDDQEKLLAIPVRQNFLQFFQLFSN